VIREFREVIERIKTDAAIKGAVITSGKATGFCAGADLGEARRLRPAARTARRRRSCARLRRRLRPEHVRCARWKTCGKPVASPLNGLAIGGGLEIALAGHYRVVARTRRSSSACPKPRSGCCPAPAAPSACRA
jgi:3-hydroxyacyl-CoA dehydrogenase/enoyl-CoA hydratase/3-hydroxybutyryl-CoA epimerase